MRASRNHHSVPQFLLRHFSLPENERQVHAFDKVTGRDFPVAIRNAAAETDYNVVEIEGERINFESAFQAVDDTGAVVLRTLLAEEMPVLDAHGLAALPSLATTQFLRTKLQRTTPQELARQLRERSVRAGIPIDSEISEDAARRLSVLRLMGSQETVAQFRNKDVILLKAEGERRFWISDNPIVMFNSFPYGDIGLSAPGIEIYFPLSPSRALAFFCPSIGKQIAESLDPEHPRRRLQDPIYPEMLAAIRDRSMLAIPDTYVDFVNELQVRQSTRFLYSDRNQFDFARQVLERDPDLSSVQSLWTVGEIGRAPPQRSAMPAGEWLIVESGTNHHAIPVRVVGRESAANLEFEPLDHIKVMLALRDAPFDLATLYRDGFEVRRMRDVRLELTTRGNQRIVTVVHVDAGLQSLMERLAGGRLGG